MSMPETLDAAGWACFSIPDRSGDLLLLARGQAGGRRRGLVAVRARRHSDQLCEARAEGAERGAADLEADLGDAEVAAAQQRHRPLDAPRHQVGVRRLAVRTLELPAQVARRQ